MMKESAYAENSPAFRRRAGDGAVFSSSKCPPGSGLKHSCELPFGFVWSPMSPSNSAASMEALPPVICLTCLSYLNLYANFDASTGVWICPLCGESNVAPKEIFGASLEESSHVVSPVMVSPVVEYRQSVKQASLEGERDSCCYILVLDGNLPREEAQSVATAMKSFLKSVTSNQVIRLGLIVFTHEVCMYQLGMFGMASADVYTPSQAESEEEDEQGLIQRRTAMSRRSYLVTIQTENDLTPLWQCLSAVYGMPLNPETADTTTVASGTKAPLSRKEQLRLRKEARLRKQQQNSNGSHTPVDTPPELQAESPWLAQQHKACHALRCTGEAVQCAVDMAEFASLHVSRTSRILLFTNGCPNVGKASVVVKAESTMAEQATTTSNGHVVRTTPDVVDPMHLTRAIRFFDLVGRDAIDSGIGIDIFCTGAESLGMPTYQALVEPSGGYALPHESFKTPHLMHNLGYVLSQTHVSRAGVDDTDSIRGTTPTMNQMDGCLVDFRMSSFVSPTHVVGPAEILYEEHGLLPNERSAFAAGASLAASQGFRTNNLPSEDILASSLTRLRMGRYDPLSTLSAMLQVNDSFQHDDRHAFFQCIVRYVEPNGETLVTRVCTHRLPVSRSVYDFLDDMDEEVVPVILGKEAVYRAIVGRDEPNEDVACDTDRLELLASEAQRDLDATIHRISGAFRLLGLEEGSRSNATDLSEEGGIASSQSSLDFAFPPELADALHRLFHLRRGALLSPGPLQSMDDRAETRSLFLRLPLDDCLCMMAPSLWSSTHEVLLEPIPSDTLALWDRCVIAADQHDSTFVWSGRATLGSEYDSIRKQCIEFLNERSLNRFPMPQIHLLSEGESMCRRFTTRLAPSHADPPEQQLVHFPALATLHPTELTALREKFRFYDASLDASFRRWFWGVASASSNARNEGMSLCH